MENMKQCKRKRRRIDFVRRSGVRVSYTNRVMIYNINCTTVYQMNHCASMDETQGGYGGKPPPHNLEKLPFCRENSSTIYFFRATYWTQDHWSTTVTKKKKSQTKNFRRATPDSQKLNLRPFIWIAFASKTILYTKSITVHQKNLQNLMTEIYKTTDQINPADMWESSVEQDMPYNLPTKVLRRLPRAQTNRYELDSLSFRGSLLWNTLKDEIQRAGTLKNMDRKVGWQRMPLFNLQTSIFFLSFAL